MGVYICLGQAIHEASIDKSYNWSDFNSFDAIKTKLNDSQKLLIFLTSSKHKIKKKAEQDACDKALKLING